tara:strand:- start:25 stop:174 length:150 start_codon:yes stop_codon:yes gene_type:complete
MIDTLKTVSTGTGAYVLTIWGILPDLISMAIGITTLVYLILKIKKEANG